MNEVRNRKVIYVYIQRCFEISTNFSKSFECICMFLETFQILKVIKRFRPRISSGSEGGRYRKEREQCWTSEYRFLGVKQPLQITLSVRPDARMYVWSVYRQAPIALRTTCFGYDPTIKISLSAQTFLQRH